MQKKRPGKRQVTFRLDTRLLDCIDRLREIYPHFTATDIVDLMLKGFLATHDFSSHEGEAQMDRAVGQYMRGEFDYTLEEMHDLAARPVEGAAEQSNPEEDVDSDGE